MPSGYWMYAKAWANTWSVSLYRMVMDKCMSEYHQPLMVIPSASEWRCWQQALMDLAPSWNPIRRVVRSWHTKWMVLWTDQQLAVACSIGQVGIFQHLLMALTHSHFHYHTSPDKPATHHATLCWAMVTKCGNQWVLKGDGTFMQQVASLQSPLKCMHQMKIFQEWKVSLEVEENIWDLQKTIETWAMVLQWMMGPFASAMAQWPR